MVRKNYTWREHAYVLKVVDLVWLRKFGVVTKAKITVQNLNKIIDEFQTGKQ